MLFSEYCGLGQVWAAQLGRQPLIDPAVDVRHDQFLVQIVEKVVVIARIIVNLLSDEFGWVTAQDIEDSGGFCFEHNPDDVFCCSGSVRPDQLLHKIPK